MTIRKIIQITDTHLLKNPGKMILGRNVYQSLVSIIKSVKTQSPDLIILTGDLSQDGSKTSYEHLVQLFKDFSCPILWTFGNHDRPRPAKRTLKSTPLLFERAFNCEDWLFLVLNSFWNGHPSGFLNRHELNFLHKKLNQYPQKHKMIFLHHHVVPINSIWMDEMMLKNSNELFLVTDNDSSIRAIVTGHVHQAFETERKGVSILATPATSFQVKPNTENFELDLVAPGYRYFDLSSNGRFNTDIIRIDQS